MSTYNYTISPIAVDKLDRTIRESEIATALDYVSASGTKVSIVFKATISESDEALLDAIVEAHDGIPLPSSYVQTVKIDALPEAQPFAIPAYRTKRAATSDWVECLEDASTPIDYVLPDERYLSGGGIIIKDAKEGDYISAEVMDTLGLIPEPYRATLCEAYPIVASYITKMWVEPREGYKMFDIDTHPLNAKISAGLCLRITYHASEVAGIRKVAVNYHLTKKL